MTVATSKYQIVTAPRGLPIEVEQLRYIHIFKAAKTFSDAGAGDPLGLYLRNNRPRRAFERALDRFGISAVLAQWVRTKLSLTVNGGTSVIIATPPNGRPGGRKDPIARLAKRIAKFLTRFARKFFPRDPEEARRLAEFSNLMDEAVAKTIGNRADQMWYIDSLSTEPASQGQGFGGALLDSVTTLADLLSQTTWLQSSNIANTEFYNSHGFFTIAEVVVGENNPTWDGEPVVVSIMVREPKEMYSDTLDEKSLWEEGVIECV